MAITSYELFVLDITKFVSVEDVALLNYKSSQSNVYGDILYHWADDGYDEWVSLWDKVVYNRKGNTDSYGRNHEGLSDGDGRYVIWSLFNKDEGLFHDINTDAFLVYQKKAKKCLIHLMEWFAFTDLGWGFNENTKTINKAYFGSSNNTQPLSAAGELSLENIKTSLHNRAIRMMENLDRQLFNQYY